jgi:ribosomal protein L29
VKEAEFKDQLRAMDIPALRAKASELRARLLSIRVEQAVAASGKVLGTIRRTRRDIARTLTIIGEKQAELAKNAVSEG